MSDGTLAVSSLSTQEQAQVSGAVGTTNTIDFNIPTTDPGYNAATGVWTIAADDSAIAGDQHERGDHQRLQPAGASREHAGAGRQREARDRDRRTAGRRHALTALTIGQPGSQVLGLDIENFGYAGSADHGGGNVQVAGCFIGTDPTGEAAAPNGDGVVIENSSNLIGGPNVGDRNVISGNDVPGEYYGIFIPDQVENPLEYRADGQPDREQLHRHRRHGDQGARQRSLGVDDSGSGDTYGGTTAGLGNVISGNKGAGLDGRWEHHDRGELHRHGRDRQCRPRQLGGYRRSTPTRRLRSPPALDDHHEQRGLGQHCGIGDLAVNWGLAGEPGDLHDREQSGSGPTPPGPRRWGTAASGSLLASVENASVLDNVISANTMGLRCSQFDTVVRIGRDPGKHDRHRHDGPGRARQHRGGNRRSMVATATRSAAREPGQGNVIAFNGGDEGIGIEVAGGQQNQITQNSIFGNAGRASSWTRASAELVAHAGH